MIGALLALAAVLGKLTVGTLVLGPGDFLDGRAIAGPSGQPVVMLTLAPKAARKVKALGPTVPVALDGTPVSAKLVANTIEVDGQPDFDAAAALALRISGKPPLPDSLDE